MTDAVSRYADAIMAEIRDDMKQPFPWGKQIPRDVASFSELHDYCDANDYALTAVPFDGPECTCAAAEHEPHGETCQTQTDEYRDAWERYMELLNVVESEVSRRLAAGELRR